MLNEAETRAEYIDPALKAAGWGVEPDSFIRREFKITPGRLEGHGQRAKAQIADYVLVYRNTKLAVIEAKAESYGVSEGLGQAKIYGKKLAVRFGYSTNGKGIYGVDLETGKEGNEEAYPTPQELWKKTFAKQNEWRDRFSAIPYEDKGGSWAARYYQDIAVERVLEAIAKKKQRILLTLATGTGKTAIAFQIAWKLYQSRWNLSREPQRLPRILFLADRNILADQAYNAFSAFPEDALVRINPGAIRKKGVVPKNGSIFFTIFQTFMTGTSPEGKPAPSFGGYPPDFFDFIVIDECHRGGANDQSTWRDILTYFKPAVQLGLTATPKRNENVDTYKYFGEPVFVYSLKEGINDGFLTPFRVKQISTTIDEYQYAPDDDVLEGQIDAKQSYKESDFARGVIEIREREDFRVKQYLDAVDQAEKSLVFCANQEHASVIRDSINQQKTSNDPEYCVRVTANDGDRGDLYLRQFQDNERTIPTVLTTSQKLSTGVDARNVRNIVLLRPVNSMIEFKQIIGRGTRLYEGKDYFTIYDFVKAHQHFNDPDWDGEPLEPVPAQPRGPRPPPEPGDDEEGGGEGPTRPQRIKVKLADGKTRTLQSMVATTFWSADGKQMSAQQFLESLYGALPELFKSEEELRELWSVPATRRVLLESLAEKGFGASALGEMQKIVAAEQSDIYDVLAYVAFATALVPRKERADGADRKTRKTLNDKQREFIGFVLEHYVQEGVKQLDEQELAPLLRIKYGSTEDARNQLGELSQIRRLFIDFQKYLYQRRAA